MSGLMRPKAGGAGPARAGLSIRFWAGGLLALALGASVVSAGSDAFAEPLTDAVRCAAPKGGWGDAPSQFDGGGARAYSPGATDPAAPWMAKLEIVEARPGEEPAVWTCGAVAIAPQWLATAAHCVAIERPVAIRAILGARNLNDPKAIRRSADAAYCHPGFDPNSLREDLALLRLESPLPPDFPLLRLASAEEAWSLGAGATAVSAGWARRQDGDVSPWLRRAEVRIIDPAREGDGLIEAAPPATGPSLCLGESGAPLIADLGRGPALHGVFTSVDVVWDRLTRSMTELCEGYEARSYFTPVRGRRLWMARVISACERDPAGCVAASEF